MNRQTPRLAHRNLPLLLLQAREQVIAGFRPILNAHGVTEQQWRVVRVLLETGPLEPREIGRHCRISSPSLAGVLTRMEELGLVQRRRFDRDQRRVQVSLTARSRKLAARMAPEVEAQYRQLEDRVGRLACQRLVQVLDEVITTLSGAHK